MTAVNPSSEQAGEGKKVVSLRLKRLKKKLSRAIKELRSTDDLKIAGRHQEFPYKW